MRGTSSLLEAYEILSSYVSHGALSDDAQFSEEFGQLAELVPRDAVRPLHTAYRVLVVEASDLDALEAGASITLRAREFGSWSRSTDAARRILRSRFLRMGDDKAALIVAKPVEPAQVVVDVQQVYRRLGYDVGEVEEWGLYASWEEEVILRQDPALLRIEPGDVRFAFRAGDPDAVMPLPGEEAWSDRAGDFVAIDEVLDEQPSADEGRWAVLLDDGDEATVSWNVRHASWDVGPDLVPRP